MKNELRRLNFFRCRSGSSPEYRPGNNPDFSTCGGHEQMACGDTDPYYKLQRIDYPITANGIVYTESFFESRS